MNAELQRCIAQYDAKPTGSGFQGRCPLCEKYKLSLNVGTKLPVIAHCFHCGDEADAQLKRLVLEVANSGATVSEIYHPPRPRPSKDVNALTSALTAARAALDADGGALTFLAGRGISLDTAKAFGVGVADHFPQGRCLVLPYFADEFGNLLMLKYRQLVLTYDADGKTPNKWRDEKVTLGTYRLFNLPLLQRRNEGDAKPLVIVESELDCLLLLSLGFDAVSVDGAGHRLTEEDRTLLLKCPNIFIAYDQDQKGWELAERFHHALPGSRFIGGYGNAAKDLGDLRQVLLRGTPENPKGKDFAVEFQKLLDAGMSAAAEEPTLTDAGNGERFVRYAANKVRYCRQLTKDGWLAWNGIRWKPDAIGMAMEYGRQTAKKMLADASAVLATSKDKSEVAEAMALLTFAMKSLGDSKLLDMLHQASQGTSLSLEATAFDFNPDLLNCQNGTYDLATHAFYRSRKEDLLTQVSNVVYDPSATCSKWFHFLDGVTQGDKALQEYLQRVFGYLLTGSQKEQDFFLIYGAGGTGKSTYWRTIQGILGDYCTTASPGLFIRKSRNAKPTGNNATPGIAALKGRRVVVTTEVNEGEKFDEGLLKWITGGDMMSARPLYGAPFDFQPQCKPVFLVNHIPDTDDFSGALADRIKIVKFERVFRGTADEVKDMKEQLEAEYSGIFNWALDGLKAWQDTGSLAEPKQVSDAVKGYMQETNSVARWLKDNTTKSASAATAVSATYDAYKKWADENDELCRSSHWFGSRMAELNFKSSPQRVDGVVKKVYQGFSLDVPQAVIEGEQPAMQF